MALVTAICRAVMDGKPKTCAMQKEGRGGGGGGGRVKEKESEQTKLNCVCFRRGFFFSPLMSDGAFE